MATVPQSLQGTRQPVPVPRTAPAAIQRVRRRRRPSGEAPPLPRSLSTSGRWWLALSGVVVLLWVVAVVTGSLTTVDVLDTPRLQGLSGIRTPWLTRVADVAGVLATPAGVKIIWLANM